MDGEPGLVDAETLDTPSQESWLKRLLVFIRSVVPADPWQLVYLIGLVFVLVLGALPMVSYDLVPSPGRYLSGGGSFDASALVPYAVACAWISLAASCVGFFTCFWPGRKPALRIVTAVVLPTVAVLALLIWKLYQLTEPAWTIFEPHNIGSFFSWLRVNAWHFPAGPYVGLFGVAFISIFAIRLAMRRSSLPISVCPTGLATLEEKDYWRRIQLLFFMLFGLYTVISQLTVLPLLLLDSRLVVRLAFSVVFSVITRIGKVIDAAVLLSISLFILGKQGREAVIKSLRLPEPLHALFGVLIPAVIIGLVPAGEWTIGRIWWVQHDIGLLPPPQFGSYVDFANAWQPWLLLMIAGAFAEEVIFRGVLLAHLIKRYSLHGGVFFTGIAWAMIHFRSDGYSGLNFGGVLLHLALRIAFCLALNYVLAWMTLRWKSIIPAVLAHTLWNILATSGLVVSFEWEWEVEILLWGVLALVLWRYWPVESQTEGTAIPPNAPEFAA